MKVPKIIKNFFQAPTNCLQYYKESTGFIRSFNYDQSEPGNFNSLGIIGTRQMADLNYNICIRKSLCSITYMKVSKTNFSAIQKISSRALKKVVSGLQIFFKKGTVHKLEITSSNYERGKCVNRARTVLFWQREMGPKSYNSACHNF